jgi:hypothetical protein
MRVGGASNANAIPAGSTAVRAIESLAGDIIDLNLNPAVWVGIWCADGTP